MKKKMLTPSLHMAGLVDTEKTVSTLMECSITEVRDLQAADHIAGPLVVRSKVVMPIFDDSVQCRSRQRWLR
eukprot:COSAG04_NODE_2472_length_4065_cov_6.460161_4_plen_72_part_00